jgi:hypothetical protein
VRPYTNQHKNIEKNKLAGKNKNSTEILRVSLSVSSTFLTKKIRAQRLIRRRMLNIVILFDVLFFFLCVYKKIDCY